MISEQIAPGLWYIGAVEEGLRTFGPASFTEAGLMYNSYLMDSGAGYILFGTLPEQYLNGWLTAIRRITGEIPVCWVVLFGTNEDRSGLKALLQAWPDAVVVGGTSALYQVGCVVEQGRARIEVRSHRSLTLGRRKLRFQVIPDKFDTQPLYVLEEQEGILLTADAFGSSFASRQIVVSRIEDKKAYFDGVKRYFADIFGRARAKGLKAAAAFARENGVTLICPARGPVADCGLEELIGLFVQAEEPAPELPTVAVVYAPGSYVTELAEQIEAGVKDAGDIAVERYDLSAVNRNAALRGAARADALLLGTSEPQGDAAKAVWDIVTSLGREDCMGKLAAVFCSTNSRGRAEENLRQRLAQLGCDLNLQDYSIQGRPDGQALKNAYEYGFGVGCSVLKIPNPHKPKLVKCLVCGEIFDASLGICPVCGVGLEQCVPVDEEAVAFRNDSDSRYVILGGGIAAVSAADAIRQRDETGHILMLSAESHLPINRPMLTKDLQTVAGGADAILVHGQEWYDERNIEFRPGCRVASIDTQARTVTTASGEMLPFDKLIYAMGAECFVPPFEGHDKPGVLTIRHLSDSQKLAELMKTGRKAVVIGGGVLGLEAASELMRAGIEVTVLEAAPQIIGRQVDADTAGILRGIMEAMHVPCYEGVSIAGIEGDGRVTGVRLGDGRVFPADFVIVSCGNRGNVEAAREAGIVVDRAIVVNQRMETNVEGVYACGDCAQMDGVNFQLWQEASDQGRTAGANAAGDPLTYANRVLGLSLEGFGTSLFAIGDPGKKADVPYRVVETHDGVANRHEKYWFYGGSLQGVTLIGAPDKVADLTQAATVHARYDELF